MLIWTNLNMHINWKFSGFGHLWHFCILKFFAQIEPSIVLIIIADFLIPSPSIGNVGANRVKLCSKILWKHSIAQSKKKFSPERGNQIKGQLHIWMSEQSERKQNLNQIFSEQEKLCSPCKLLIPAYRLFRFPMYFGFVSVWRNFFCFASLLWKILLACSFSASGLQ